MGTWDCVVHRPMMGEPSKSTETIESFGDFWTVSEFEGAFMGTPFKGMSLSTFDPIKQKYVSRWCDTMTPSLFVLEGTMDASGKTLTSSGQGPNIEHEIVEYTNVLELESRDEDLFTMYETAKGADDPSAMKIEYRREK